MISQLMLATLIMVCQCTATSTPADHNRCKQPSNVTQQAMTSQLTAAAPLAVNSMLQVMQTAGTACTQQTLTAVTASDACLKGPRRLPED